MRRLFIVIILISLVACATPAQRFNQHALDLGFKSEKVDSAQFQHRVFLSKNISDGEILHVYLDGDGTPWERNRWIADDPSARNPLILNLMNQDKMPSILLGRPCYYGFNQAMECDSKYWTSHRYSKQVIDSMAHALNKWLGAHNFKEIVLIGYSGGGTIAILMAGKINNISTVVTVAANLDVARWSEFHGYSALKDSLNPTGQVALDVSIKQIHFAGKDDEVVPLFIIKEYADSQKNAKFFEMAGKDHVCCWQEGWPRMLKLME